MGGADEAYRILDHLYNKKISNTLILSGDSHANWVSDLAREYPLNILRLFPVLLSVLRVYFRPE